MEVVAFSENYNNAYSCAINHLTLNSLMIIAGHISDNKELEQAAQVRKTLWEKMTLTYMRNKEFDLDKRKDKMSEDIVQRLLELKRKFGDMVNVMDSPELVSEELSCYSEELQNVYNLYYIPTDYYKTGKLDEN